MKYKTFITISAAKIHRHNNIEDFLKSLEEKGIAPAEAKAIRLIEERKHNG